MCKRLINFWSKIVYFMNISLDLGKNHSTVQAVMEVLDNIYEHCDSHEITMGIYLDLQKAFDTVNHTINQYSKSYSLKS